MHSVFGVGLAALALLAGTQMHAQTVSLDDVLSREHAAGKFDGFVQVTSGGKVILRKAYGAQQKLNAPFRIASLSKQMTALIVMQEVVAGRLSLDDSVGKYWPDFPNEQARSVTIRQLLQHMSGLANPDDKPDFYLRTDADVDNHQALAATVCAGPLKNAPGAGFDYNNCDYLVLGALLEKITGQPAKKLFEARIFKPAGMKNSWLATRARPEPVRALMGYNPDGTNEQRQTLSVYGVGGAVVSTLADMQRFNRAVMTYKLLPRPATEQMFTGAPPYMQALGSWSYALDIKGRASSLKVVERQGSIGGIQLLSLLAFEGEGADDDMSVLIVSTTQKAELFKLYAGEGLPIRVLETVAK
jgi:D-alanyl-D-alanine carboxypeptidase